MTLNPDPLLAATIEAACVILRDAFEDLVVPPPVTHLYNPLQYAWPNVAAYIQRYVAIPGPRRLLLGMNPGPWGMAQTGIPFGDVPSVRDWLKLTAPIEPPPTEHPKRPILGLQCPRREVSGTRLWGWAESRFKTPESFFQSYLVWNYCPLSFMAESGRNITPNTLPKPLRERIFTPCDAMVVELVELLGITELIGIGQFAYKQLEHMFRDTQTTKRVRIGQISHPSPASPKANKGWAALIENELAQFGKLN